MPVTLRFFGIVDLSSEVSSPLRPEYHRAQSFTTPRFVDSLALKLLLSTTRQQAGGLSRTNAWCCEYNSIPFVQSAA